MCKLADGGFYSIKNGVTHELGEAFYFAVVREDEVDVPVLSIPLGELLGEGMALVLLEDEVASLEGSERGGVNGYFCEGIGGKL